jgi:hypothetical protein
MQIYIPTLACQGMVLATKIDPENPYDVETARLMQEVEAFQPQSIQDFFIRLNDLIHQSK